MKKLLVFLMAALMMMSICACGETVTEIKEVTEAVQGTTASVPKTTAATTAKSSEEEDGIDAGVVSDNENDAEGAHDDQAE